MASIRPLELRLFREAKAARWFIASVVALALVGTASTMVFAWQIARYIADSSDANLFFALFAVLSKALAIFLSEYLAARAASEVKKDLRSKTLEQISNSPSSWRSSQTLAELNLLINSGLDSLDSYFSKYLPQVIHAIIATPIYIVVIWLTDPISGVSLALTIPLIPIFMAFIGWATNAIQNRELAALTTLANRFTDAVRGLTTLRVFQRTEFQIEQLRLASAAHRQRTMKVISVSFLSGFALELIASLSVALIAVSIGLRLLNGQISFFVGLFVLMLAPDAFMPLRNVGASFHSASAGVSSLNRIYELFDSDKENPETVPAFVPKANSLNVLFGPSGVGKTTSLSTLFSNKSAWVPQSTKLLSGTIKSNIIAGLNFQSEAFNKALELSCLGPLDPLMEVGVLETGLSGGQAQRVALARAVYRILMGEANALIADEPTSAQDQKTTKQIVKNLKSLANDGKTVVVVSHQREFRAAADYLYELK